MVECGGVPAPVSGEGSMGVPKWLKSVASIWKKTDNALGLASKVTVGATAASLATTRIEAQSPTNIALAHPLFTAPADTVHRYGEKFILTPSDSVVIRADTVWYPRRPGATTGTPRSAPRLRSGGTASDNSSTDVGSPVRSSGSGHASHASHASHSSHRSGGWV